MATGETDEPARQLPALDPDNRPYWTGGADGQLLIQRCDACGHHVHPPLPRCSRCGSDSLTPSAVSGRGRVAAFTVNEQAWVPGLRTPYVFAAVELEEQGELYVFTNIVECAVNDVTMHMPVEVLFEQHEDVFLPFFRPAGRAR
ncbi:MAG: DNA-binding protein [Phenylobacterium sp.]|nr:DNA-binding protein [Phenylobacterium sp.]